MNSRIQAEERRIHLEKKLIEIHNIVKEYADDTKNDEQYVIRKILEIISNNDFD